MDYLIWIMETSQNGQVDWFHYGTEDRCEVYFRTAGKRVSGTTFEYDSLGSFMLGAIVEKVIGKPFLEYMKARFLFKGGFSDKAYCREAILLLTVVSDA